MNLYQRKSRACGDDAKRRERADFIVTDLQIAMMSMETAGTTSDPQTREHNLEKARKAHEAAAGALAAGLQCSAQERAKIDQLFTMLGIRLAAASRNPTSEDRRRPA